ncbi:AAA family ATPase [Brachyspira catarrhinii]|uniref:ATPase n=1 Tax=Brachyspira catarrhinii TaxID=2528966 RepID=A0ABY2TRD6_9SPIR|nr:AAA family ATPase [Brachyspira catarrhinii]TKZ35310.1 ATPase [Brachyspira catarrhinii]
MNCWVISPNVLNDKSEPVEDFIELMSKNHVALIGWGEDNELGYKFKNVIKRNDLIIIAQGANFQKRNFFAGLVNSEAYKYKYKGNENNYTLQAINLKNFIDIKDKSISWNNNCAYGEANRIPALYELKSDNTNDKKVIDEVLYYINNGGKMTEYIELLKSNKNLILTGAPGTGKTYLAKQIASKMILNKDYDESVENDINFKEQCAFVQFHPSYDYTDFVEGLRPENKNGNIGFIRKDGVFKAFCKKALKNLKDSEKDISTLNYEEIIKKYLEDFYNDVSMEITNSSEGYKIYGIGGGIAAPIIDIVYKEDEKEFRFTVKTKNDREHIIIKKLDLMADYYKKFITKKPEEWKFKDFIDELKITHYHTYIYGFLKAFYDKYNEKIEQEKNNITIEEVKKKDFVFIIDEINRGEISKIFGELFFSVDSGYRGEKGKVLTQYANLIEDGDEFKDGFYIPENVYIIGTMNDIDRSVESMDFAMRRRFAWKEIKAEDTQETILNDLGDLKYETIRRMDNLNNAIKEKAELSEAYYIGAAYFKKIKDKDYNGDFDKLWNIHLKMLLFEYTRGMANQEEIMKNLKDAYNSNSDNDTEGEEEIIDEE